MLDCDALILAGRRPGGDALAAAEGVSHRALVELGGRPMLARVVEAVREATGGAPLAISIDDAAVLGTLPELAGDAVRLHESLATPSASVADVLARRDAARPLLVTTADHPLLGVDALRRVLAVQREYDAEVAVGVVDAARVAARFADARPTALPLRGAAWCGANCFALRGEGARRAVDFWIRAERQRKRPWRLLAGFGPRLALAFALRRLDLDAAVAAIGRRLGARVRAVPLDDPAAALDVDDAADLALARRLLAGDPG